MIKRILISSVVALSLGGCAKVIGQLQAGTVALNNFNNALITLNTTIINNLVAQQKQLAPLECGAINLGNTLLAQPAIAKAVNSFLVQQVSKEAATTAGEFQVTATALCQAAGLSPTVTAIPVTTSVIVPAAVTTTGG